MQKAFDRTVSLIGEQAFDRLAQSRVIVVGLGGVGGAAAEVLARSGVGALTLVDGDAFEPTNLNRQILCTVADVGKKQSGSSRGARARRQSERERYGGIRVRDRR